MNKTTFQLLLDMYEAHDALKIALNPEKNLGNDAVIDAALTLSDCIEALRANDPSYTNESEEA